MEKKEKDVRISARIPIKLKLLMQKYVERDAHLNESDFIRDAIREKIQKEAPDLYKQLFKEKEVSEHGKRKSGTSSSL